MNGNYDRKEAAVQKILHSHPNLDLTPFFQWEAQLEQQLVTLFYVIDWFERAAAYLNRGDGAEEGISLRKLNALYQFIRRVPSVVESCTPFDLVANNAVESEHCMS